LISIFSSPSSAEDGLFVWHPASRIGTGGKEKLVMPVKSPVMRAFQTNKTLPRALK
jgi:hypothetical protein